ncbi:hypothetical protein O6H91_15G061700 [Diphasiastrum complanatum]|uniref:Uncharacterized protein n=2 Tax=Diphasiastrum complanatum TaxID=34168 RepID=A0ACC2BIU4_DIPCM|nr:hypothetical protein O6H91_15G061700 [Diphasiastrum complanatum]KAJ7529681.1 hypothetical protein O6H91_15G061700 [Diphasiastrum complanatum]
MAEKFPQQILGGRYEGDSTFVSWASPRISFSSDFVQVDQEGMPIRAEDRKHYSSDFEFAMADAFNPPGSLPSGAMLSADELISDGKLLPCEESRFPISSGRHSMSSFMTPLPDLHASSSSTPSLKASKSYPSSRADVSSPISPKAPRCGATLRELFRFKTKHYLREKENVPSEKEEKASYKLFKLFSRSRSVGSEEIDRLVFAARPLLNSKAQADAHSFPVHKIFTESSSLENSFPAINRDALANPESYAGSPARLWMRPVGKHAEPASKSKVKSSCTSPGRIVPLSKQKEGSPGTKNVLKSSSFLRDGEKGSTARIVMKNLDKYAGSSSSNENKRIHGNTKTDRWGEYRFADNRVSHSRVRVAPVLLNVPACIAPSLRGVKVSKTKLANLRHLLPPKKVERPKNF